MPVAARIVCCAKTTRSKTYCTDSKASLKKKWDTEQGKYRAIAYIKFNDKKISKKIDFMIGKPSLNINSVEFKDFQIKKILGITTEIENKWNEDEEITAQASLIKEGKVAASSIEQELKFSKRELKNIDFFIDTKRLNTGDYTLQFILKNQDISYKKEYPITLDENKASIKSTDIWKYISLGIIAFLVFSLIVLIIIGRRREK